MNHKVVINTSVGGFSLSDAALARGRELGGELHKGTCRHDPVLVAVVEELGEAANGHLAYLQLRAIEGSQYSIILGDSGVEDVLTPESMEWTQVSAVATTSEDPKPSTRHEDVHPMRHEGRLRRRLDSLERE
jgi:hypothetical protein